MIALTEAVQVTLITTMGAVIVATIPASVTVIVMLVRQGRRSKRVDAKTDELRPNHGTTLADRVAGIVATVDGLDHQVKALAAGQMAAGERHNDNRDSILGIKDQVRELERRMIDYQVMSSGERAKTNERLTALQSDLRLHMTQAAIDPAPTPAAGMPVVGGK